MIALATVLTLADLGTILPEPIARARFLAVPALEATATLTATVGRIAYCPVRTLARLLAVRAPNVRWTTYKKEQSETNPVF